MGKRKKANSTPHKPFRRSLEILKTFSLHQVIGFISLFAVGYLIQHLLSLIPNIKASVSWTLTIIPFGLLNLVWDVMAQKAGKEIKFALVLDWLELSITTHLWLIIGSVIALLTLRITHQTPNDIQNVNPQKDEVLPANPTLAYDR